jgi:hypothetical protein
LIAILALTPTATISYNAEAASTGCNFRTISRFSDIQANSESYDFVAVRLKNLLSYFVLCFPVRMNVICPKAEDFVRILS